jgi:hypothetical protein
MLWKKLRTRSKFAPATPSTRTACQLEALESRTFLSANPVAITTRFGNELVITATTANDSVDVAQSGSTLNITADGQAYSQSIPAAGIFIYTRGGSDSVTVESSVTARTTVDAIDGAATTIHTLGANVSVWMDSTDTETGAAAGIHAVASFAGGTSKALGAALANPKDAKTTSAVTNRSLFGTGPVIGDANQGAVGDCWFISSMASMASQKPSVVQESAVDMGDGTYAVEFYRNGTPSFIRVSNQFTVGKNNTFYYAKPGANNTIWALVMEKALCYFRSGKNTYNSTSGGFANEGLSYFNVNSTTSNPASFTQASLYAAISYDLSHGLPVQFGTTNPPNLVSDHEYTIVSCYTDATGATYYVVRNPWGVSGDSLENSLGYATLTYAQLIANASDLTQAV